MASDLDCNYVRTLNYTDQCDFVLNNTLKYLFFILSTIYFWLFLLIVGEHIQDLISDLEITKCCAALQIVSCDLFRRQKCKHFLNAV